jgi:serine/threonine protein kinase
MATVYLAHDERHGREVAVKVLRDDLAASLGAERFHREIRIAAALQHPHILPLYDSGDADGLLYYVMPFVDGVTLRDRLLKEGELPIADAVRILRDIADALAAAHKRDVVHRDLKPENVMLSGRHALVTDFGVAKALSESTGRQSLTTIGVALGTPTYMAPEQGDGRRSPRPPGGHLRVRRARVRTARGAPAVHRQFAARGAGRARDAAGRTGHNAARGDSARAFVARDALSGKAARGPVAERR